MQEMNVRSLGWEDPLKKGTATHNSIHAWEILWTEESGGLQSMGHKEADTSEMTLHAHVNTPQGGVWGLWFVSFLPLEVQSSHVTFIECKTYKAF